MTIGGVCYRMFEQCISLSSTPNLSSTHLGSCCYHQMFYGGVGCISLMNVCNLPATKLPDECYLLMFSCCPSLSSNVDLSHVEKFGSNSCEQMYAGAGIREVSFILNKNNLFSDNAKQSFYRMFNDCDKLSSILLNINTNYVPNGSFEIIFENCPNDNLSGNIKINNVDENAFRGMFKSDTTSKLKDARDLKIEVESSSSSSFRDMFWNNINLIYAPELSGILNIGEYGFTNMFYGCSKLTDIPNKLPIITLSANCYEGMFNGCQSLETPPQLPATSLAQSCYLNMFNGCVKLISVPALPALNLAPGCYKGMFQNCDSLTTIPNGLLPATSLASDCYHSMFWSCNNLLISPELPATTLINGCYYEMFRYCSKINNIKVSTTEWHENATNDWLYGVSPTGFFDGPMDLAVERGPGRIPEGWNIFEVNLLTDTIKSPDNLSVYYTATINGENVPDFNKLLISSNITISNKNTSGLIVFDQNINADNVEILFKYPCCEEIISSVMVEERLFNVSLNKNIIDYKNESHDWYFTDGLIKHTIYYVDIRTNDNGDSDGMRIRPNDPDFLNSEPTNLKSNGSLEEINRQTDNRTRWILGCLDRRG